MTIYDISKKAGVSIATVSRVLNGRDNVSARTREKVLAVIAECDYTPNLFARGLGLNTANTIGILCVDSSDLFLAKAVYHLEESLHKFGYDCLLCCTGYEPSVRQSYMKLLLSKKVDAVILIGSILVGNTPEENAYIREAAEKVPILLLNASLNIPNVYSVLADDYQAIYQATTKFLQAGIRDILFYYNSNSYSGHQKLSGFQDAMLAAGIPQSRILTSFYGGDREDIAAVVEQLNQLTRRGAKFDAVIASDDNMALAAVKYAKSRGLSVPKDFSIIGYNNSLLARCSEPELSSIDNHLEQLCRSLTDTLVNVLEGKETALRSVYSTDLVCRGTTSFHSSY